MTLDELKATYTVAYKIIRRERAMRDRVFAENQEKRHAKMAEMDILLELIDTMKDELKKYLVSEPEQAPLIEVPRKTEYR